MPLEAQPLPHVAPDALAAMIASSRTALLVVDIQNDFAGPNGVGARVGLDREIAEGVIDRIEALIDGARMAGAPIFFARVITRPETDSTALKTLMQRRGRPGAEGICRAGTPGADYYRVQPRAGDGEIEKPLFSCFHGTDFDAHLRARGVDTLVITGMTTDCCVDCTARDAFHHNYNVFVVSDATCAYSDALHAGALSGLEKNCALLTTSTDVMRAWTSNSSAA
jgi:nicotinamidase-related amidase